MKLKLKKISKGRYENRAGNILVTVEKCTFTNYWIGKVEVFTHIAQDVLGAEVEMFDELFTCKDTTKKRVSRYITNFIINN